MSNIDFLISWTIRLISLTIMREEDSTICVFRKEVLRRWRSECARNLTLSSLFHPRRSSQVSKSLKNSESTPDHPGRDSVDNPPGIPSGRFTYRVRYGSRGRYMFVDPTRASLLFSDSAHDEWLNSLEIKTESRDGVDISGERGDKGEEEGEEEEDRSA